MSLRCHWNDWDLFLGNHPLLWPYYALFQLFSGWICFAIQLAQWYECQYNCTITWLYDNSHCIYICIYIYPLVHELVHQLVAYSYPCVFLRVDPDFRLFIAEVSVFLMAYFLLLVSVYIHYPSLSMISSPFRS